jgi:hypothetical protein
MTLPKTCQHTASLQRGTRPREAGMNTVGAPAYLAATAAANGLALTLGGWVVLGALWWTVCRVLGRINATWWDV